jgi:hypothetical protein
MEGPMVKFFLSLVVGALVLSACKGSEHPGGNGGNPPPSSDTIAGVWSGSEGPLQNNLTPTARLEIIEDGGVVYAVWYSSNVFGPDGGSWPVGALYGFRDGGTLYLRNTGKKLPDGGLEGGTPFTATITGSHLEGVDQRTTRDGGPLPIYLKVDRAP